jgi:enamine deaminase RidA (YjgF/YER057c/UK114 family)
MLSSTIHSSAAVRVHDLVFTSGLLPMADGRLTLRFPEVPPAGRRFATGLPSVDAWIEPISTQIWSTYDNMRGVLAVAGSDLNRVVLLRTFTRKIEQHLLHNALRSDAFSPDPAPPNTGVEVAGNPLGALFQGAAIAHVAPGHRQPVFSTVAAPVSDYLLGVRSDSFLWFGVFVPFDSQQGSVVLDYEDLPSMPAVLQPRDLALHSREVTVRAQAWWLYDAIRQTMMASGAGLERVVRLTVYLVDPADIAPFAQVHKEVFATLQPVVVLNIVGRLGRPEFRIAIEVTALAHDDRQGVTYPSLEAARCAVLPSAEACVAAGLVFVTGLDGTGVRASDATAKWVTRTGDLPVDSLEMPFLTEASAALERLARVLKALGSSLDRVASMQISMLDLAQIPILNRLLRSAFATDPPALTVIQVPSLPLAGASLQVEAIASTDDLSAHVPWGEIG